MVSWLKWLFRRGDTVTIPRDDFNRLVLESNRWCAVEDTIAAMSEWDPDLFEEGSDFRRVAEYHKIVGDRLRREAGIYVPASPFANDLSLLLLGEHSPVRKEV